MEASGAAADYVAWMAHQRRGGADGGLAALGLEPGDRALDLGCGPGVDLAGLTGRVAPGGVAVGVDRSATMAGAAAQAAPHAALAMADGQALPFADAVFAGCWARAVLVHTPDPAAAVTELARVVRPGGTVVLGEPDHGTHVVSTDEVDVFDRVLRHRRTTVRHPLVGRDLPHLAVGQPRTGDSPTTRIHRSRVTRGVRHHPRSPRGPSGCSTAARKVSDPSSSAP